MSLQPVGEPAKRPQTAGSKAARSFIRSFAVAFGFTLLATMLAFVWFANREPLQAFASDFDANLAHTIPIAAEALHGDAALHDEVLRRSQIAFARGGWPAASAVLQMVMVSKLGPYADDEHIIAMERAELAILTKLQGDAAACARYVMVGSEGHDIAIAEAEGIALNKAQWALVQSGAVEKRRGAAWYEPGDAEWRAVWKAVENGKFPLTQDEALAEVNKKTPTRATQATLCSASVKISQNILALSPARDAVYAGRILVSFRDRTDWVARMNTIRRGIEARPRPPRTEDL